MDETMYKLHVNKHMTDKAQKFWDKQAKKFESSERHYDPVYKEVIAKTKQYLDTNDHVLDFGCATGTKTIELAAGVNHIHGLDLSSEMIKEAMKKKDKTENVSFSHGSIFDGDFKEASFDKIIAYAVIHLLEDAEKAVQRIHALLNPGGLFISTTACFKEKMAFKNRLQISVLFLLKRLGMFPLHINMFRTSDIEKLIESHNFHIIKGDSIFHEMTISFIVAKKQ